MPKPTVIVRPYADQYAAPNERIIEFGGPDPDHGGLISIRILNDGTMRVDVYRQGSKVVVGVAESDPPTR